MASVSPSTFKSGGGYWLFWRENHSPAPPDVGIPTPSLPYGPAGADVCKILPTDPPQLPPPPHPLPQPTKYL